VQQGKLAKNNGKEPARKRFNLGVAKNADKSIRPNAKLVKNTSISAATKKAECRPKPRHAVSVRPNSKAV
jgi:hypothetical protein